MSYNNGPYFIMTWRRKLNRTAEKRAQKAIHQIDPSCELVVTNIPGNETHMWLERPNDGTNDYNDTRGDHKRCIAVVEAELAKQEGR